MPSELTLADVDRLFHAGKFTQAAQGYDALLTQDANSIPARVGLIRSYLRVNQLKQALDSATAARAQFPESADVQAVMGEVRFRLGELDSAEQELSEASQKDRNSVRAILGLFGVYKSKSLYRRAYQLLRRAHDVDPNDAEVKGQWIGTLQPDEQVTELERYVSIAKASHPERVDRLNGVLTLVKGLQKYPKHNCELATKSDGTETKLWTLMYDATHERGLGVDVGINNRKMKLLFDTGATGIIISRSQAEKSGVVNISESKSQGIGDQGVVSGYTAYAQSIRIGDLEFRDCVVSVINSRNILGGDGLIGADVFREYLVQIDYPGRKLRLGSLPKHPNENETRIPALDTIGEFAPVDFRVVEKSGSEGYTPQDRYIAPEMEGWTRVRRFGHLLLIPASVNGHPPKLFLVDTGAGSSMLSTEFAKQVTNLSQNDRAWARGISGDVSTVYLADPVTLEFADLQQTSEDVMAFDLSRLSDKAGTEISGILGISALKLLEIKIDYRDGLVEFVCDPKRVGESCRKTGLVTKLSEEQNEKPGN